MAQMGWSGALWSTLMFGSLAILTIYTQIQTLLR